jgi:hypothetical protein
MPDLPALTVSQAHFDRIVSAFPGATNADKASNYKAWLTNHLIDFVEMQESRKLQDAAQADMTTKLQALRQSLPPRINFDPTTGVVTS